MSSDSKTACVCGCVRECVCMFKFKITLTNSDSSNAFVPSLGSYRIKEKEVPGILISNETVIPYNYGNMRNGALRWPAKGKGQNVVVVIFFDIN